MDNLAIRCEKLGKRYKIGALQGKSRSLSDVLHDTLHHPIRQAKNMSWFRRPTEELWAVKDVSFEVKKGEIVGIVGRNGAGKSTLLKLLARITDPTEGQAVFAGKLGSLLEVGIGFHPDLTGRENVYLYGVILGMKKAEIDRRFDEIVAFGGVEKFIDTPMKHYSSGMYVRLAFAVAAHLEPDILLIDEVLAVGDAAFQNKCLGKIDAVTKEGRTVLFVSHNMPALMSLCNRAILLHDGHVVADGPTREIMDRYLETMKELAQQSLKERRDRKGDQSMKFVSCEMLDANGVPITGAICGQDTTIALAYESPGGHPLRNVHIELECYGRFHESLFQLSTSLYGQDFEEIPPKGVVHLKIPCIPLQPGKYSFDIYSTVSGTMSDFVQDAGILTIEAGDFYGSGKLPPHSIGKFLLSHSWDICAPGQAPIFPSDSPEVADFTDVVSSKSHEQAS